MLLPILLKLPLSLPLLCTSFLRLVASTSLPQRSCFLAAWACHDPSGLWSTLPTAASLPTSAQLHLSPLPARCSKFKFLRENLIGSAHHILGQSTNCLPLSQVSPLGQSALLDGVRSHDTRLPQTLPARGVAGPRPDLPSAEHFTEGRND